MTAGPARASAGWLALREPADAAARAPELVESLRADLPAGGTTVHDLGCGTGSMARWLAPRLAGPQRWVLHDRDAELLPLAAARPPAAALDGAPVTVETRRSDLSRLDRQDLADADLITASALLDMLTADEVTHLVATCAGAACPVLIPLTVTGHVELTPAEPFDERVREAFNAHQQRAVGGRRLLGPGAAEAAEKGFTRIGHDVQVRRSPWRLGPSEAALAAEWFGGWLSAACEQQPELRAEAAPYARRRLSQAAAGRLAVTVGHADLLARPR